MKKYKNLYLISLRLKQAFIVFGLLIVVASTVFTAKITKALALEEKKKIEVWVEATRLLVTSDIKDNTVNELVLKIIEGNTTIPVIIADTNNNVLDSRNLNLPKSELAKNKFYEKQITRFAEKKNKIIIPFLEDELYFYYDDSRLLKFLYFFPYIQLGLILIFILITSYAFISTKRTEQNRVWVGLSKETAHQLGTPISSLLAWGELLKIKYPTEKLIPEIEKDVNRLGIIAERFSKIGSIPDLKQVDLNEVINNAIEYIKKRSSKKVEINCFFCQSDEPVFVNLNVALFDWVIENICKNAVDAMNGEGVIDFFLVKKENKILIDIKDTGKGLEKKKFKAIFMPGYTTKKRGWGLGLSLAKRIVEHYHNGKIFVKESEKDKGTTFRIVLNKSDLEQKNT